MTTPEAYVVQCEFAESQEDPFEAILELRARVEELEADFKLLRSFGASDTMTRYTMAKKLNAHQTS